MPKVARRVKTSKIQPTKRTNPLIPSVGELHKPSENLSDYCFLIYGQKSMGKTTLLSQLSDKSLVCMFEDRTNLPIRMVNFPSATIDDLEAGKPDPWQSFKEVAEAAMESDEVDFLCIDSIDLAYAACLNHVAHAAGYRHPGEANDYGTTWHEVTDEFRHVMETIRKSSTGLAFCSHCTEERLELNTGSKEQLKNYTVYSPSCPRQPTDYLRQSCDYVFFYGKHGSSRALHFRWDDNIFTACGNDEHFLTEDGDKICALQMPSKTKAGQHFRSAFFNKPETAVLKVEDSEE